MEVAGKAGAGKTQLCLHLCASVQVPVCLGGLGGEAVFIDAGGDFKGERMAQVVTATKEDVEAAIESQAMQQTEGSFPVSTDSVIYKRVHSADELTTAVSILEWTVLSLRPRVRLVVVDGIAFHFRYAEAGAGAGQSHSTTSTLFRISSALNRLASVRNVAVVVTNQMSARPDSGQEAPFMSDTWGYCCTQRLILSRANFGGRRTAALIKSPFADVAQSTAEYCITEDGIRDAV